MVSKSVVLCLFQQSLKRPVVFAAAGLEVHPLNPKKQHETTKSKPFRFAGRAIMNAFLPAGYPESVHRSYGPFAGWTLLQGAAGTVLSVISTQSLFSALIPGATATESTAASAAFNWVLKDGLGYLGGIAMIGLLGPWLDGHARSLRFFSSGLLAAAAAMELSIPWIGGVSGWEGGSLFVPLASAANVAKNVAWMLGSATKAHFLQAQALKGNLGELTGKAGSQMTLATLLGTAGGLAAIQMLRPGTASLMSVFVLAIGVKLFAAYRACRVAVSRQLTGERLHMLLQEGLLMHRPANLPAAQISRYLWTPELMASKEPIFSRKRRTIAFNVTFDRIVFSGRWIVPPEEFKEKGYLIYESRDGQIFLWTGTGLSQESALKAVIHAHIAKTAEMRAEDVLEALRKQGWDCADFLVPAELSDAKRCLVLKDKSE